MEDITLQEKLLPSQRDEYEVMEKTNKSQQVRSNGGVFARVTVEPVIFLYFLAHTATHQVLEQLIYTVISEKYGVLSIVRMDQDKIPCSVSDKIKNDTAMDSRTVIQSDASYWMTYMRISASVPAIFTAFVWANVSDRSPRKLPILLPLIANAMLIILAIGVVLFRMPIALLLVGYFLEGIGGSTSTFLMGCYAYLANVSSHDTRTARINVNEICIRYSHSLASLILGQLLKSVGFMMPFSVITTLYVISIVYVMQVLPAIETTTPTGKEKDYSWSVMYSLFSKERPDNGRVKIIFMGVIYFLVAMASISRASVNILYLQNQPFCWNARNIGMFFALDSFLESSWSVLVLLFIHNRLGDSRVLLISASSAVLSMATLARSTTPTLLYISLLFAMPHHVGFAIMRAMMSKLVDGKEQGAVFSSIAFAELMIYLLCVPAYNIIYAETVDMFPGCVFWLSASLYATAFILTMVLCFRIKLR